MSDLLQKINMNALILAASVRSTLDTIYDRLGDTIILNSMERSKHDGVTCS